MIRCALTSHDNRLYFREQVDIVYGAARYMYMYSGECLSRSRGGLLQCQTALGMTQVGSGSRVSHEKRCKVSINLVSPAGGRTSK